MAATVELGEAGFEDAIRQPGIVLVDWWAPWCGPCRAFGPIFERVAARHPDATFAKVNTEAEQALVAAAGIQSIPTLMVFRDGLLLYAQPGALPEPALEHLLTTVRGLDLDAVRAELARARAGASGA